MKIVILDGYGMNPGDMSWQPIEELGELTVYDRTAPADVVKRAGGAQIVLTNKTVLDAAAIDALPDLRYIGVLATGYNVVDIAAAARRGIVVTNIPAYSTDSVAQMVFAHLLAITNRVEHYAADNRAGRWSHCPDFCYWDEPLHELAGKTIGIVGLGNIGSAVARIALAFGMKVKAFTSKEPSALPAGVVKASMDEIFTTSDVVTLHCPLTDSTRHLVNAARLAQMKPTAILINTGRGPLVDDRALADALNDRRIYAAGIDVMTIEPPAADNPLLSARNCFITPHQAWATTEARHRLLAIAAANIRAYLAGSAINTIAPRPV